MHIFLPAHMIESELNLRHFHVKLYQIQVMTGYVSNQTSTENVTSVTLKTTQVCPGSIYGLEKVSDDICLQLYS